MVAVHLWVEWEAEAEDSEVEGGVREEKEAVVEVCLILWSFWLVCRKQIYWTWMRFRINWNFELMFKFYDSKVQNLNKLSIIQNLRKI